MGRWVDVLNDCDDVLEAATKLDGESGTMAIDHNEQMNRPVISVLRFTSLLFENSFSRSVYSSMDHLLKLLDCRNMLIVVQTLRLLLVISKSSRYITQHVQHINKRLLYMKLTANTESWTGKLRNVKMSECCTENFNNMDMSSISFRANHVIGESRAELHKRLNDTANEVEESERILAVTKLRLAHNFVDINSRFLCVMSRLISISVLFYSRCLLDEWRINCLINDDLIEQICALLQLDVAPAYNTALDGVKTEAMKTLASIVFLRNLGKYNCSLVRTCVEKLKSGAIEANSEFSVGFVTALFSLVYHIAGFDYGGESLISCSMIGALLGVVKFCSFPDSQISFVTRAVRIIDILTGIDVTEFNTNDGMSAIVDRFSHEVEVCKKQIASTFSERAVVDTNYATQVRRIMEGDLPTAIVHIVENPQYYGSSLLHCAIHLTTSFIYQEPAQLTFLQDKGLTDALLQSLFNEKFPISRDIVTGLPNICSALCLNERGLKAFNERNPLERIFRIIFSTKFVSSLRKRKTEILEAATTLGTAFDELLRHQPTLRKDLMNAFVKILDDILAIGSTEGKKCTISWNIGKAGSAEEDQTRKTDSANKTGQDANMISEPSSEGSEKIDTAVGEQSIFQICYEQDGTTFLPLGDYAGIIGSLLEAVLTNRAAQENSLLILECDIPRKLVKILTFGRPYPAILQSSYLQNLANIIRHLLSQSNKVDAFEVLVSNVSEQLKSYERCKTPEDILSRDRMHLLTRMSSLVFVVSNFMKTSLTNVHDTRSLLLNYFASNESGQAFIHQLFEAYRDLNHDLLYLNSQTTSTSTIAAIPGPSNIPDDKPSAETSTANSEVPMETNESAVPSATTKAVKKGSEHSSLERSIHSIVSRSHKQIGEVIIYMGKTFCNSITRVRRGFDSSVVKDSHKVAEMLFGGVVQLLKLDVQVSGNWSGIYICHSLSILKSCYSMNTKLGYFLVENASKEEFSVGVLAWLSIVQRLVCATNILSKSKNELRSQVEGFEAKKYLSVCQNDAIKILGQFFKAAISTKKDSAKEEDCKLLDKIIGAIQVLVRGVVYVHELEKKHNAEPELEVLIHELDTEKVQRLVEMGFSQSDAVDALLQHTSVPEAAEYLIAMGEGSSRRSASGFPPAAALEERPVVDLQEALESLEPIDAEPMGEMVESAEVSPAPVNAASTESTQEASSQTAGEQDEQMETDQLAADLQKPCTSTAKLEELISRKPSMEKDQMLMFSISELLAVFINDPVAIDWVQDVLIKRLIEDLEKLVTQFSEESNAELSTRFASLLHLFCLLWQNFDNIKRQHKLDSKLIPPLLLCIDMYEKEKRVDLRQQLFTSSVEHVQWVYWVSDERYGTHNEWPTIQLSVLLFSTRRSERVAPALKLR
uniref:UBA domain-containing protein n=1 Tax=Ditylenchus dipsaci TaxID=166011 RepID=A0A915E7Q5_9BILA